MYECIHTYRPFKSHVVVISGLDFQRCTFDHDIFNGANETLVCDISAGKRKTSRLVGEISFVLALYNSNGFQFPCACSSYGEPTVYRTKRIN